MPRKPAFISHSTTREAEIQARLLAVLEARFWRLIAAEISRESADLVARYEDLGFVPPQTDQHIQAMRDLYRDMALRSSAVFVRRIISQGKAAGFDIETKEGFFERLFNNLASAWVNGEAIRRRIQSVTDTTRETIARQVAKGQAEGLGVDAIARQIREAIPNVSRLRGALIARTETHGAANFAAFNAAKETGLDLEKEWLSVIDMRTRSFGHKDEFDHISMNGQTVAMDQPFLMPWKKGDAVLAMYPGEAMLPGGAVINCRCSIAFRVKGLDD